MHVQFRKKRWRAAAIVVLLTLLFAGPIFSQSAPPPAIDDRGGPPLTTEIRRTLEAAVAQEEKAKKIGVVNWLGPTFPMPVCIAGKCGAVNRDGTYAVVPAYNSVESFFEGRAVVQVRNRYSYLYGYVDETGRVIWKPQFSIADRFSRGFAQVDFEGRSGLIDREGQVVVWPQFGFVVPFTSELFWVTEERSVAQGTTGQEKFLFDRIRMIFNGVSDTHIIPKGKWGLVDRAGAWIQRPEFLDVRVFDKTDFHFMWARTDAGWGLIRPDLTWQVEPKFVNVGSVHEGLAPILVDHRWGFVDTSGRVVIEPVFENVGGFSGSYAPVRMNNLYGLIDRSGAWVVEPKYNKLRADNIFIPKAWWEIEVDKKYGLLDDSLRMIISPQLDQSAAICADGRITGVIDKKRKMFSRDGTPLEDDDAGCDSMVSSRRK